MYTRNIHLRAGGNARNGWPGLCRVSSGSGHAGLTKESWSERESEYEWCRKGQDGKAEHDAALLKLEPPWLELKSINGTHAVSAPRAGY